MRRSLLLFLIVTSGWCTSLKAHAQVNSAASNPATPSPVPPFPTQIKNAVVFLQTDCLHDFNPDITQLTPDVLSKMPQGQVMVVKQKLNLLVGNLQKLKQSMDKLTSEEIAWLKPERLSTLELPQLMKLVSKMASLTTEDIKKSTPAEIATLPADSHTGTGFIVVVPDERIPVPAGSVGKEFGFGYLVTNRHVAQPGIEDGKPCNVLNYSVLLNRINDSANKGHHAESMRLGNNVNWHFSTDDSVDLAVLSFTPPTSIYYYQRIPVRFFTTQEMVEKKLVVEGDPVLFEGLFIQTFEKLHSLEPILRSGTLAMVPEEDMETTLHKPGRVYLAEVHAFGGNSGSPVFVDTNKFANIIGSSYSLLGVISGEVQESSDFTLHVTTSLNGIVEANSDVSVVVPSNQIKDILYSPSLQADRDAAFTQTVHPK